MTFKLEDKYPDRVVPSSEGLPRGKFKNRTSPNSEDGSYLEETWANDDRAFPDTILLKAGVTPNGEEDSAGKSQVYDALMQIIRGMIDTSTITLYAVATGSPNQMLAQFSRAVPLKNGSLIYVRSNGRNSVTDPTLAVNGQPAKAIVKGANQSLDIGDISGAGHVCQFMFDERFDRWILMNPALGVTQTVQTPLGAICYFGRRNAPAGWNLIDSREYQRSEYPEFLAECPDFVVAGSSPNTFKLIDLRGYFIRALDNGRGVDGGRGFGSIQGDCIRNITGSISSNFNKHPFTEMGIENAIQSGAIYLTGSNGGTRADDTGWGACMGMAFDASRSVPVGNENRPKNIALPMFIKMK